MQEFNFYLSLGWEHIMSWDALDHLLFITALTTIYLAKDWKRVLILVTAFTIGHSLTLALSVLDVLRVDSGLVEFLIPCTIVVTALIHVFQKDYTKQRISINYLLALFFGLIHGLGFANIIRFSLAQEQSIGTPLLAFNIGLELGQIVVVAIMLAVSMLVVQVLKADRRHWVIFVSAAIFSVALKLALERIPA